MSRVVLIVALVALCVGVVVLAGCPKPAVEPQGAPGADQPKAATPGMPGSAQMPGADAKAPAEEAKPAADEAKPAASGDLASCPVLGTTMPKDQMIKYEHEGKTYYFCCQDCVDKFKADPEKYIKNPHAPLPPGEGMKH